MSRGIYYATTIEFHNIYPCSDVYMFTCSKVCENTAKMIAKWSTVGFTHGVMNTDNMSIGEP